MKGEGRGKEGEGPTFSLVYATPLKYSERFQTDVRLFNILSLFSTNQTATLFGNNTEYCLDKS